MSFCLHDALAPKNKNSYEDGKEEGKTHRDVKGVLLESPIEPRKQALREQPLLRGPQAAQVRRLDSPSPLARDELPREQHADEHVHEKLEQAQQPDLALRRRVRLCARWVRVPARDRG